MKTGSLKHMYIRNPDTGEFEPIAAIRGESAYEIAVRLGTFSGTEEEWIAALETERAAAVQDIRDESATANSEIADAKAAMLSEIELAAEIVQTTGDSETAVMSQKAVTDSLRGLCGIILGNGENNLPNFDLTTNTLTFPPDTGLVASDGTAVTLTANNNSCSFAPTGDRYSAVKFCYVKATQTLECFHFNANTPNTTHILVAVARLNYELYLGPFNDVKASINCDYKVNGRLKSEVQPLCAIIMGDRPPYVVDIDTVNKKVTFPPDTGLVGVDGYVATLNDSNRVVDFYEASRDRTAMKVYFNKRTGTFEVTPYYTFYSCDTHILVCTWRLNYNGAVVSINAPHTVNGNINAIGKYNYVGEKISLKNTFSYELANTFNFSALAIAHTGAPQCVAYHHGYYIVCFIGGGIAVYASDYSLYKEYVLALDSPPDFHAANIFLYGEHEGSGFPYLYISETTGNKQCYIVSLGETTANIVGKLSYNGTFGNGTDYFDWVYDNFRKTLLLVGYYNYGTSGNYLVIKNLGTITSNLNKIYTDADVVETYNNHDMTILQGGCFANGSLVYAGYGRHGEGLYFIDPYRNDYTKSFVGISDVSESEGVMFDGNNLHYLKHSGAFYKFYFY